VIFVLAAGLYLGPWLGALSMCAYLLVGLVAPVYAGGTVASARIWADRRLPWVSCLPRGLWAGCAASRY